MAKALRLFYLYRLLATSYLWQPVFVFFMIDRGLAFDEVMLLSVVYSAIVVLIEVPTGAFADRIGRRQSMMLGALAMVASCLFGYAAHGFGMFLVSQSLAGMSMALCSGADSAYLFDLLQENGRIHEYPRRESHASAWHMAGNVAACVAGGLLATVDLGLPYLVNAGTAAVAFVVALLMHAESRRESRPREPLAVELKAHFTLMRESLAIATRNKRLAWIIFYSAVVFALVRVTVYLYQPYLVAHGFNYWQTGMVYAGVFGIGAIFALRYESLRAWLGEGTLVWGLLATLAISFLLLNSIAGPWALAMLAVQGATKGLYSPLVKPILNREITDSSQRATVLSVESIARRTATGVVSLVAAAYGAYAAIYWCGALGVAGFAVLALASRWQPTRGAGQLATMRPAPEVAPPPVEARLD